MSGGRKKRNKPAEHAVPAPLQAAQVAWAAEGVGGVAEMPDQAYAPYAPDSAAASGLGSKVNWQEVWNRLLETTLTGLQAAVHTVRQLLGQVHVRRINRRLSVRESVSLGDRRFVAIVKVDDQEFLLGGAHNSVSLLAQISTPAAQISTPAFSDALRKQCEADQDPA